VTVEFANVVEAPHFVHGKTSSEDWLTSIRLHPAPWAELETKNLVITVPSSLVRGLQQPDRLMDYWAQVLDACADLASIPRERKRAERFVFDVQITNGFMHSGYPIMAHVPSAAGAIDLRQLMLKGGWGFYHELGHNHQEPEWTFEGTTEVTCNLFSLYVLETLTPRAEKHDNVQPGVVAGLERKHVQSGRSFEQWKKDPFLALVMYQQLQQAFGWDAYKKVFQEYQSLSPDERPKTDDEERDQWMVRFSRAVSKNLGPFFEYWGVPTSQQARQSIANLPTWMPPGREM
jgi:hypothetical protein